MKTRPSAGGAAQETPVHRDLLALLELERSRIAIQDGKVGGADDADVAEIEAAAAVATSRLSPTAASTYSSLVHMGRLPVVAPLVAGCCGVCFIRIPTSMAGALQLGQSLARCPHCHRVLYLKE